MTEFHSNNNEGVALKIFELGLKDRAGFISEPKYVCAYMHFLQSIRDAAKMRVLCERVLASMPPDKTPEVFSAWLDYENAYGELSTIEKLQLRKAEVLPEVSNEPLITALQRFRYENLWPCHGDIFKGYSNRQVADTTKGAIYGKHVKAVAPKKRYAMPDLSSMRKWDAEAAKELQKEDNLAFELPGPVAILLVKLPRASLFSANPPSVDRIVALLREYQPSAAAAEAASAASKRKREDEIADVISGKTAAGGDVFRLRQRMKKKQ